MEMLAEVTGISTKVRVMRSGQRVPDFLEKYKPEEGIELQWDDKSEPEEDAADKVPEM